MGYYAEADEARADLAQPDPGERRSGIADDRIPAMRAAYAAARTAASGSLISCPVCGKPIRKTTYHRVFCSSGRTRGGNCKDRYWNAADPERAERAGIRRPR